MPQALRVRGSEAERTVTRAEPEWESGDVAAPRKKEWLLPGRIPLGALVIIEGDTDVGKSVFLAALAAAVTTGRPWLGRKKCPPKGVLWLSSEEDMHTDIRPRLVCAGADLRHWHRAPEDEYGARRQYTLPGAIASLRDAITQLQLGLVIMEPLASHVSPDLSLADPVQCRAVLDPLNQLGMATRCTIAMTRGWRKDRRGPRTAWGEGGNTIGATARATLSIERCEGDPDARLLRGIKVSGTRPPALLRYRLVRDAQGVRMEDLVELGRGADPDLSSETDPGERDARRTAADLLRAVIGREWVPFAAIRTAMEAAVVSISTLRRAKVSLGVRDRRVGFGPGSHIEWGPPEVGWTEEGGGATPDVVPMAPMAPLGKKPRRKSIDS